MTPKNEKQQEAAEKQYAALIAQLPAEMQSRIVNPTPVHLQAFEDMVEDLAGLRYNLTKLLVDYQRDHKLENWDDDDFEDFHLLMAFLENQQYIK